MDKPTLLLTRPAASSVRFVARLEAAVASRADLLISPLLEIVPRDVRVELDGYLGVIFTSANGVQHGPDGEGRIAYCVGNQTAAAAKGRGWRVEGVALDADAMVDLLKKERMKGPFLHLSGAHQRGDIAARLTRDGLQTDRLALYDQNTIPLTDAAQAVLCGEGRVVLPLFSARTAAYFVRQATSLENVSIIAISNVVADEFERFPAAQILIVPEPTSIRMIRAVELLLARDR